MIWFITINNSFESLYILANQLKTCLFDVKAGRLERPRESEAIYVA